MEKQLLLRKGVAIWLSGLSSSGKTTIGNAFEKVLSTYFVPVVKFDGDEVRPIVAEGLGYSVDDRKQVSSKYAKLSNLLCKTPLVVLVAAINHTETQRKLARATHSNGIFIDVWIDTPLEICKQRDIKGLYKKAINKEISDMVGVHIPFEQPSAPDLILNTTNCTPDDCASKLFNYISSKNIFYT